MRKRTRLSPSGFRRTRRRWLKAGAAAFLLLLLLGGISYATHRSEWRIQTVRVTGAETVSSDKVQKEIQAVLSESRSLGFLARDNVILYPRNRLRDRLRTKFPRLRGSSFSTKGLNELQVKLLERQPYGLYCGHQPDAAALDALDTRPECLLLDRDGVLFSAPTSSTSSTSSLAAKDRLPIFVDQLTAGSASSTSSLSPSGSTSSSSSTNSTSRTTVKPGKRYLPAVFPELVDFLDKLPERELEPRRVIRYQPDSLRVELASGCYLLLDLEADLDRTWRDLDLLLERGRPGSEIGDLSRFQYIDLRFGDRVFYKLSGEAGEGSEEEETAPGTDPVLGSDPATSTASTSTDAAAGTTSEEQ